jgi:hypothetical protein
MSQQNNYPSQWPKAFVAVLGTACISAVAYFLKDAEVMWAMVLLIIIIGGFE